jgi:hypothetical protein
MNWPSSLGANDAEIIVWLDGRMVMRMQNCSINSSGQNSNLRGARIGVVTPAAGGSAYYEYLDQIYIDNTPQRVFISNVSNLNSTWPNVNIHHDETQVPTSWSDSSIVFTFNQGSFATGEPLYLYVVDTNGNISNGFPIGNASDSPRAPTGLRVVP